MAVKIEVVKKHAEIDGKPIDWNVLAITGYLAGDYQTLELKMDRTQAMLAGMLINSDEDKPEQGSRKASSEERADFGEKIEVNNRSFLDD